MISIYISLWIIDNNLSTIKLLFHFYYNNLTSNLQSVLIMNNLYSASCSTCTCCGPKHDFVGYFILLLHSWDPTASFDTYINIRTYGVCQSTIHVRNVIYVIYDIYDMYGAMTYNICMYVNMGVKRSVAVSL